MKKLALCIHDLRASDGAYAMERILDVRRAFGVPVTVHLVCDRPMDAAFAAFLRQGVRELWLEVAFHGTSHACPRGTGRLLAFYHKGQAEYLEDNPELRAATAEAFAGLEEAVGERPGICPPCWLSSAENLRLFRSLEPEYIEFMLRVLRVDGSRLSPIISLGSPKPSELWALRLFARLMALVASASRDGRVRMAIHTCDFEIPASMDFFRAAFASLSDRGFEAVRLRDLLA